MYDPKTIYAYYTTHPALCPPGQQPYTYYYVCDAEKKHELWGISTKEAFYMLERGFQGPVELVKQPNNMRPM